MSSLTHPMEPLKRRTRLLYGLPNAWWWGIKMQKATFMRQFYTDGYPRAGLGFIAFYGVLGVLLDAFTDPAMGLLTDSTRSKHGRRRPYLAVAPALGFVVLLAAWAPPGGMAAAGASHWYGIFHIGFVLFDTLWGIPYQALGAELTADFQARNALFTWQEAFLIVGVMLGSLLPALVGGHAAQPWVAAALGGGLLLSAWALVAHVREGSRALPQDKDGSRLQVEDARPPIIVTVLRCLRNRAFRVLLLSDLVEAIGAELPFVVLPYMMKRVVGERRLSADDAFAIVAGLNIVARLLALPLWLRASRKYGKWRSFMAFMVLNVLGTAAFITVGEDGLEAAAVVAAFVGLGMSGNFLLYSMLADCVDYDEFLTGERREGQYSVFVEFVPKFVQIPSQAVPFLFMAAYGYDPDLPKQPDGVVWTLRLCFSLVPTVFIAAALWLLRSYPLRTEAQHAAILEGIAAHREGRAARDPLTGEMRPPPQAGLKLVNGRDKLLLDHFTTAELEAAIQPGRAALSKQPLALCVLSVLALPPCVYVVVAGWAGLSTATSASISPIGLMAVGIALVTLWFSSARLSAARAIAQSETLTIDKLRLYTAWANGNLAGTDEEGGGDGDAAKTTDSRRSSAGSGGDAEFSSLELVDLGESVRKHPSTISVREGESVGDESL